MTVAELIAWLQEANADAAVYVSVDEAAFALVRFVGTPVSQTRRPLTHVTESTDNSHIYLEGRV